MSTTFRKSFSVQSNRRGFLALAYTRLAKPPNNTANLFSAHVRKGEKEKTEGEQTTFET
jgi:hypothetical protein